MRVWSARGRLRVWPGPGSRAQNACPFSAVLRTGSCSVRSRPGDHGQRKQDGTRGSAYLGVFALLDGLLHRLQRISREFGRHDELAVDVLDLLHHVRLELGKGLLEPGNALQRRLGCLGSDMRCGPFPAERLEDGVQMLDRSELVVEDVGPRITPLLCRGFELSWCWLPAHNTGSEQTNVPSPASSLNR